MSNEKNETGVFRRVEISGVRESGEVTGMYEVLLNYREVDQEFRVVVDPDQARWAGRHLGHMVTLTVQLTKPEFGGTEDE